MTKRPTAAEIEMILDVVNDGSRADRCLRRAGDGTLYVTDNRESPYVEIPWDDGTSDPQTDEDETAVGLVELLDEQIADA